MSERRYEPAAIEPRWQEIWERERTWEVANRSGLDAPSIPQPAADRESAYVLEMLPYPSGEPHIGHLKVYSVGDAIAHYQRRLGRRVLHPMGYDSFGLPAENHAIKTGVHPRESTAASIASFQRQFRSWGISIDWSRELATHEPSYYRWTQWIFLQLLRAGLAYRREAAVKWCPHDQTVLANEQVDADGRCERCGALVEVRQLEQWFLSITDYAERLLTDLDTIAWPEHVKTMQRNWIGRSEGAEVTFRCEEVGIDYQVFTTRPDTLFGATFFVMAPEHPDVLRLVRGTTHEAAVRDYVNRSLNESNEERGNLDKPKTGVALGRTVTNPVNGEQIPMYVADYVLMEYGTGAIMAVPAHDERDYAFARAFDLPIRRVVQGGEELPYSGDGPLTGSRADFDGMGNREALRAIVEWLEREGKGHASVNYRLRDWLVSRQRYWGCPIPIVYCEACGMVPVPEEDLPVRAAGRRRLPAQGPLAARGGRGLGAHQVPAVRRPGPARDRHDGHLRRLLLVLPALLRRDERRRGLGPQRAARLDAGRPVHRRRRARDPAPDVRALLDQGARRPRAARLRGALPCAVHPGDGHQGRREDEQVQGNVVSPASIVERVGADAARCYILFVGPPDQDIDWSDEGLEGVYRFLGRLWRIATEVAEGRTPARTEGPENPVGADLELVRKAHWAIEKVSGDLRRFAFNTAISAVMEIVNDCYRVREEASPEALAFALATGASLLFPFAPHLGSEVYELLTGERVWEEPWPESDERYLAREEFELVCQVNGKVRDRVMVPSEADEQQLIERCLAAPNVKSHTDGQEIVRRVVVPGRLVNIVVR